MKKIIAYLDSKHNVGLYELMTSQIYTAVLGSIIYMLFDWGYKIFSAQTFSINIFSRTLFLLVGVAFYLSDYYYIKGSNPFRKMHFIFGLIFMGCMLYSVKLLNVEDNIKLEDISTLELKGISKSYGIFFILYLIWDIRELIVIWNKRKNQRIYYWEVITWEVLSLVFLLIVYKRGDNPIALLITLVVSTIWFCSLAYRKSEHVALSLNKERYEKNKPTDATL